MGPRQTPGAKAETQNAGVLGPRGRVDNNVVIVIVIDIVMVIVIVIVIVIVMVIVIVIFIVIVIVIVSVAILTLLVENNKSNNTDNDTRPQDLQVAAPVSYEQLEPKEGEPSLPNRPSKGPIAPNMCLIVLPWLPCPRLYIRI